MTKQSIMPAPGYILVKTLEEKKATASGIVLPESHEEKPSKGKVVALGNALTTDSGKISPWAKIKKGSIVIYKKWSGNEYQPSGSDEEVLFIKFEDILAIEE